MNGRTMNSARLTEGIMEERGMKSESASYKAAGVDITAGYRAVELMRESVARTKTRGAMEGLGGFGGLFLPDFAGMKE